MARKHWLIHRGELEIILAKVAAYGESISIIDTSLVDGSGGAHRNSATSWMNVYSYMAATVVCGNTLSREYAPIAGAEDLRRVQ